MYNVSSSFGAQLYTDQQLITHGPFAYVRHPMYLGILLVGWGGLLLYRTWTFVFIIAHFPVLLVRARHEEQALAIEFGEQWQVYSQRVPAWLPRFFRACNFLTGSRPNNYWAMAIASTCHSESIHGRSARSMRP
jgi:protein-S-isoprenylcysteine O-methyltransferase Ste14